MNLFQHLMDAMTVLCNQNLVDWRGGFSYLIKTCQDRLENFKKMNFWQDLSPVSNDQQVSTFEYRVRPFLCANELKHIAYVESLFKRHFILSLDLTHNSNQIQKSILHLLVDCSFQDEGPHKELFKDVLHEGVTNAIKLL